MHRPSEKVNTQELIATLKNGGANVISWQERLEAARLAEMQATRELKRSHEEERHLHALNGE